MRAGRRFRGAGPLSRLHRLAAGRDARRRRRSGAARWRAVGADACWRMRSADRAGEAKRPRLAGAVAGRGLTERLQAFARRERVTLNTLVQGAWAQLLRQHTGRRWSASA